MDGKADPTQKARLEFVCVGTADYFQLIYASLCLSFGFGLDFRVFTALPDTGHSSATEVLQQQCSALTNALSAALQSTDLCHFCLNVSSLLVWK